MSSNTSYWGSQNIARKILIPTLLVFTIIISAIFLYILLADRADIQAQELAESLQYEQVFNSEIELRGNFSQGLAISAATNPEIQAAFAAQDREKLQNLTMASFEALEQEFAIPQYQYHLPPAISFLRLHSPENFGDDLSSFRLTVLEVYETNKPVVGLEVGRGGLGLRGIEPVFYKNQYIGSVEFGVNIDESLITDLKNEYGNDWRILLTKDALSLATLEDIEALSQVPETDLFILASSIEGVFASPSVYNQVLGNNRQISRTTFEEKTFSITSFPLYDFSGKIIGVIDILFDQTTILQTQRVRYIYLVISGMLALIIGASLLTYGTSRSLRTLSLLTEAANELQKGNFDRKVKVENQDEIGLLASAFNSMSSQLQELFSTLDARVIERTQAINNVAEISQQASNIQDLKEMLAQVVHLTQRRFGLYHAHVFLFDEKTNSLQIIACGWHEGDEHEGTHGTTSIPIDKEHSLVAKAARTKAPVIINDVRNEPDWLPNPLLPDTASELAVPLIVGNRMLGVLDIQSDVKGFFTESDADVQLTLAAQVAVAVENLQRLENFQKVANDLGVVAQVGIATATITNIDQLLQDVVDLSKSQFKLYHAHIYMLNESGDALVLAAGAGEVGRTMVAEGRRISMDAEQSLVVRAARSKQGVVANDVAADPNFLPNPLLPETRSEMAVPMVVSNHVIGVLDVQSETIGRFSEIDINIKTTLATQIAVAVQNARNFEQSRKQAQRETAVNLIAQRIQSATNVEAALQVAARELGHALGMKPTLAIVEPASKTGEQKAE